MAAKVILALCASVLCIQVQSIFAQNCGCNTYGSNQYLNLGTNNLSYNNGASAVGSGGSFPVTSYSPITPSGISLRSENTIEGVLDVCGDLPLLAAVSLEGQVPSNGQASVQYGCGNGNVGITESSGISNAGINNAGLSGAGLAGSYAGAGLVNGCGCVY